MATSDNASCASFIRFGVFEVDLRSRELRKNGVRIRLQEQPFQVLVALLTRAGEVVSREDLRNCVWPEGTFVCFDYALNTAIKKIRVALSDDANIPRYVETIPRRGYRFIGNIDTVSPTAVDPPVASVSSPSPSGVRRVPYRRVLSAGLVGLALMASAGAYFARRASPHQVSVGRRTMLVVVPFENLGGDPDQDSLCEGLTEELITQLGRVDPHGIGIAARSTVNAYEGGHRRSVAEMGRDLRADYVLEGSVRRNERMVRVSAHLIRTTDQSHVWANEFDRELDDVLVFQSDIAANISQQVRTTLLSSPVSRSR
jgi:TolB-like protein/DNA-binding winged helix-turn-helix (wHTH) protein